MDNFSVNNNLSGCIAERQANSCSLLFGHYIKIWNRSSVGSSISPVNVYVPWRSLVNNTNFLNTVNFKHKHTQHCIIRISPTGFKTSGNSWEQSRNVFTFYHLHSLFCCDPEDIPLLELPSAASPKLALLSIVCKFFFRFSSFSLRLFRLLFTAWISSQASDIV